MCLVQARRAGFIVALPDSELLAANPHTGAPDEVAGHRKRPAAIVSASHRVAVHMKWPVRTIEDVRGLNLLPSLAKHKGLSDAIRTHWPDHDKEQARRELR